MTDEKRLNELTQIIHEMILEMGDLKERVASLEERLSGNILPEPPAIEIDTETKRQMLGEGYENLGYLYRSGYHICPELFGQILHGECLFCTALMNKK